MKKGLLLILFVAASVSASFSQSAGDIVINEFMANPSAETDAVGEYVELFNTTGADIDINGWILSDDGTDSHTISGSTIVPAGGYLVLGRNAASGSSPDYVYSSFQLANGGDEIVLSLADGTEITRVNYSNGDPFGAGVSAQLPEGYTYPANGVIPSGDFIAPDSPYGSGDLGTPGAENILPITLVSFDAVERNERVVLNWTTAQEINNDFFTIERSNDARNFTALAKVDGAGNSDYAISYDYTDATPANGVNYYRLMQTDRDGTFTYSEVVSVNVKSNGNVFVAPTYVNETATLYFDETIKSETQYEIFNINGQTVFAGTITMGQQTVMIEASNFVAGQYFVRFNDAQISTLKFVKL